MPVSTLQSVIGLCGVYPCPMMPIFPQLLEDRRSHFRFRSGRGDRTRKALSLRELREDRDTDMALQTPDRRYKGVTQVTGPG